MSLRSDPDKMREYKREWARKNNLAGYQRTYRANLKKRVQVLLGGRCVYCGCDISEALEINHIDGGGRKEWRERKGCIKTFYLNILAGRRTTDDLELTCKICNSHHHLVKLKGLEDGWTITWHP